ncbi:MAG: GTP 3',8-cyclase MoaA [Spirochaetaceae bacterium]|nr:GTP 3',8-cyclase MoaA [Spirochaetaceae bacterium]
MKDNYGRIIDYLRISLTDRCNFRCRYCMPPEGVEMMEHKEILTLEEIVRLAEISAGLGVSKVRLTGGEPLVRKGVVDLIRRISSIHGIGNISMTTNGFFLEEMAEDLKKSGLTSLNVSLDTVSREKFKTITRCDGLEQVLRGISAAKEAGFNPIKINAVALRGFNDDEIISLADYAVKEGLLLRFIEQMPFDLNHESSFMAAAEIIEMLCEKHGEIEALEYGKRILSAGSGPASLYRYKKSGLITGFITPVSNHFCGSCNRLRVTSDGKLKPCLLSADEIDLRVQLRNGSSDESIRERLISAIGLKPESHELHKHRFGSERGMSKIGG